MKKLILTSKFTRALRKYTQRDERIKTQVKRALELMEGDVFNPKILINLRVNLQDFMFAPVVMTAESFLVLRKVKILMKK